MKESVSHQAPKVMYVGCSNHAGSLLKVLHRKKLQFSLFNNQDTVKLAEFEVTHRDLYTPIDRLPVKNGVLDRRLVRALFAQSRKHSNKLSGYDGEKRVLRNLWALLGRLCRTLRIHQACRPCLPHRILQAHNRHPTVHMQGGLYLRIYSQPLPNIRV